MSVTSPNVTVSYLNTAIATANTLLTLNVPDCTNNLCHETCVGFQSCQTCTEFCRKLAEVPSDFHGPGGPVVTVLMCLLPLIVLVVVTVIPRPWKSTFSLPFSAAMMYVIRLAYLGAVPANASASIIAGALDTMTPISIVAGAIILFETMTYTRCMPWMMRELKLLSKGHPVAEIMLIGWAFAYMVEGASGFGTPVALAAPMLAELGHPKFETVVLCLLTNTMATVFGAVGTPVWFGFGSLGFSEAELITTGFKGGVVVAIVAMFLLPVILLNLVHWRVILRNIIFILLSTFLTVGPAAMIGYFSYEFGTIIGGIIGIAGTLLLIRFNVGLRPFEAENKETGHETGVGAASDVAMADMAMADASAVAVDEMHQKKGDLEDMPNAVDTASPSVENIIEQAVPDTTTKELKSCLGARETGRAYAKAMALRTFPLWSTVFLLILTRIEPVRIKGLLRARSPALVISFRSLGVLEISPALVFFFHDILRDPAISWVYETLYTPAFMPFVVVSLITMLIHRKDLDKKPLNILGDSLKRLADPVISLMGALVLVSLIRGGGLGSPAFLIGSIFSGWVGKGWIFFSTFVGALGSFFSGSTTVSNLTFGNVQVVAARNIGIDPTTILALQCAGATMGNAICMANIIN
eukprot:Ihof_evm2s73 gene=Ihof_evmTU2s73